MYVCICNAITEQQIRDAAKTGSADLWTLQRELGLAAGCGSCKETALAVLRDATLRDATEQPARATYPPPRLYYPQPA